MQLNQELEDSPSIVHERLFMVLRRTLKRRDRLFLVLHYLQELTIDEVACVMECSSQEVATSIHRSMDLVCDHMETGNAPKVHSRS